jgi:uncharacterized Fe-S cluster-containing protein
MKIKKIEKEIKNIITVIRYSFPVPTIKEYLLDRIEELVLELDYQKNIEDERAYRRNHLFPEAPLKGSFTIEQCLILQEEVIENAALMEEQYREHVSDDARI